MERLAGPTMTYKSHDAVGINDRMEPVDIRVAIKILNREIAPEVIKLKVRNVLGYEATILQPPSPPFSRSAAKLC